MQAKVTLMLGSMAALLLVLQPTSVLPPSNSIFSEGVPLTVVLSIAAGFLVAVCVIVVSVRMARLSEIRRELMDDNARRAKELAETLQGTFNKEFEPLRAIPAEVLKLESEVKAFPAQVDRLVEQHKASCAGGSGPARVVAATH